MRAEESSAVVDGGHGREWERVTSALVWVTVLSFWPAVFVLSAWASGAGTRQVAEELVAVVFGCAPMVACLFVANTARGMRGKVLWMFVGLCCLGGALVGLDAARPPGPIASSGILRPAGLPFKPFGYVDVDVLPLGWTTKQAVKVGFETMGAVAGGVVGLALGSTVAAVMRRHRGRRAPVDGPKGDDTYQAEPTLVDTLVSSRGDDSPARITPIVEYHGASECSAGGFDPGDTGKPSVLLRCPALLLLFDDLLLPYHALCEDELSLAGRVLGKLAFWRVLTLLDSDDPDLAGFGRAAACRAADYIAMRMRGEFACELDRRQLSDNVRSWRKPWFAETPACLTEAANRMSRTGECLPHGTQVSDAERAGQAMWAHIVATGRRYGAIHEFAERFASPVVLSLAPCDLPALMPPRFSPEEPRGEPTVLFELVVPHLPLLRGWRDTGPAVFLPGRPAHRPAALTDPGARTYDGVKWAVRRLVWTRWRSRRARALREALGEGLGGVQAAVASGEVPEVSEEDREYLERLASEWCSRMSEEDGYDRITAVAVPRRTTTGASSWTVLIAAEAEPSGAPHSSAVADA